MRGPEHRPQHSIRRVEQTSGTPLPAELAAFLKDKPYAALTQSTYIGTVLVIKAPGHDIQSVRGTVPILLRHELHDHPAAPVIRMVTTIYDQPERPLALETFINVGDEQQHADFAALTQQKALHLLFYDEQLAHRLSKTVSLREPDLLTQVLQKAEQLRAAIPQDRFDFDAAKKAVMEATHL